MSSLEAGVIALREQVEIKTEVNALRTEMATMLDEQREDRAKIVRLLEGLTPPK